MRKGTFFTGYVHFEQRLYAFPHYQKEKVKNVGTFIFVKN